MEFTKPQIYLDKQHHYVAMPLCNIRVILLFHFELEHPFLLDLLFLEITLPAEIDSGLRLMQDGVQQPNRYNVNKLNKKGVS